MKSDKNLNPKLECERRLIYLLLHDRYAVENFAKECVPMDFFCEEHRPIVHIILDTFRLNNHLITRNIFLEKLQQMKIPKDRVAYEFAFARCYSAVTPTEEYNLILEKFYNFSLNDELSLCIDKLTKNKKEMSTVACIQRLSSDCEQLLKKVRRKEGESYYDDIRNLSTSMIQYIEGVRSGEISEEPLVLTGIDEVDETMMTGLEKGTLTLFCADVAGGKSTIILNIALNVWEQGYDVLFVPLEMHKNQMWKKACSREAKVNSELFYKVKNLSDEQIEKIKKAKDIWDSRPSKFFMMQEPGRITVSQIQKAIENHIDLLRPRLVVIDYVANLEADKNRYGRNDLEIGDMLKEMREMGKTMNFAVISAAQLGRDALKRIRKSASSKEKAQVHSEDIRGSHEYSADADNIYAMLPHPHEPKSKIDLFVVKARNGKQFFKNNELRATLGAKLEYSYIYTDKSMDDYLGANGENLVADNADVANKTDNKKIDDLLYQEEMAERKQRILDSEFSAEVVPDKPTTQPVDKPKNNPDVIDPSKVHDDPTIQWDF
jgi:replicative DNA helicase